MLTRTRPKAHLGAASLRPVTRPKAQSGAASLRPTYTYTAQGLFKPKTSGAASLRPTRPVTRPNSLVLVLILKTRTGVKPLPSRCGFAYLNGSAARHDVARTGPKAHGLWPCAHCTKTLRVLVLREHSPVLPTGAPVNATVAQVLRAFGPQHLCSMHQKAYGFLVLRSLARGRLTSPTSKATSHRCAALQHTCAP